MRWIGVATVLVLCGCSQGTQPATDSAPMRQPAASPSVVSPEPPAEPPAPRSNVSGPASPAPAQTAANDPSTTETAAIPGYFDDRSKPEDVIRSYYNAINRGEYSRAYRYWRDGRAPQPYGLFKLGFENTALVQVTLGKVTTDAAMSQRWATVPTALTVTNKDGSVEYFGGCYITYSVVPQVQDNDNFQPMSIARAKMVKAGSQSAARQYMSRPCE